MREGLDTALVCGALASALFGILIWFNLLGL
jgi:hypothetical protein